MTRHAWMSLIVWTLMMHGNQVTVPRFAGGYLEDLTPVPPSQVSIVPDGGSYRIMVSGAAFQPDEALHFMVRPDPEAPYRGMGYGVSLADVVRSIRQTNATKDAIMRSPAPSIIVKVDGLSDEFVAPRAGIHRFQRQRAAMVHPGGGVQRGAGEASDTERPGDQNGP